MQQPPFHGELRDSTRDLHERLDAAVGEFQSVEAYRAYLRQGYRFRRVMEAAVTGFSGWCPDTLLNDMALDLRDLGELASEAGEPAGIVLDTPAGQLGALYVLEGSSLGARILLRRAEALGLNDAFGARHLARQAGDRGRWPRFLRLLESADGIDRGEAGRAAARTFELALSIYREPADERA